MTLKTIRDLQSRDARTLAQTWFDRLDSEFGPNTALAKRARDVLEAHLIEALEGRVDAGVAAVEQAISQMGDPAHLAADWIEDHADAAQARGHGLLRVFNTIHRFVGIVLGSLLLIGGAVRLIDPKAVGVFVMTDGSILLGTPVGQPVATDLLGPWTAPVFVLLGAAFLVFSVQGLRLWLFRKLHRMTT